MASTTIRDYNRIIQYLYGEMDDITREDMSNQIEQKTSLKEEVESLADVAECIEEAEVSPSDSMISHVLAYSKLTGLVRKGSCFDKTSTR